MAMTTNLVAVKGPQVAVVLVWGGSKACRDLATLMSKQIYKLWNANDFNKT